MTLNNLTAINDTFHIDLILKHLRHTTEALQLFRYLPYTHFIFETPEITTDYLQQFGLNERNQSSKELSSDDKNLLH